MEISAIRYGEPLVRSARLVISWSAVALITRSANTPGSIRSMTVLTPRLAIPTASRAPWLAPASPRLIRSVVAGSLAVRVAAEATSSTLARAASAASCALLMKLTRPSLRCRASLPPTRSEHSERAPGRPLGCARHGTSSAATRATDRRPLRSAGRPQTSQLRGDRGRLAWSAAQAPSGRGWPGGPGSCEAHQCRPRLAERSGAARPIRPRRRRHGRRRGPAGDARSGNGRATRGRTRLELRRAAVATGDHGRAGGRRR